MTPVWIGLGALLALPYLAVGRRLRGRRARIWWSGGLVLAALVYVALALAAGSAAAILAAEVGGALAFGAFAALGLRGHLGWVAAGWLLHAGWDLAIQSTLGVAPTGYLALCIGFDAVVGIALYLTATRR